MVRAAIINDDLLGASWFANVFAINDKSKAFTKTTVSIACCQALPFLANQKRL